jgi:hypothetical protein
VGGAEGGGLRGVGGRRAAGGEVGVGGWRGEGRPPAVGWRLGRRGLVVVWPVPVRTGVTALDSSRANLLQ